MGIGTNNPQTYYSDFNNLVVYENGNAGIAIIGSTSGESSLGFGDGLLVGVIGGGSCNNIIHLVIIKIKCFLKHK